jgi:hypothetical protein
MPGWKTPPIEKIHEAYGALADGRVEMGKGEASVTSSDGAKRYTVTWQDDVYASNDNASYWQGYMGYPVIAVLMLQGRVSYDKAIAAHFGGINWKALNTAHKNKYDKAVAEVMEGLRQKGVDCDKIDAEIAKVYGELKRLDIGYQRGKRPGKG